MKNMKKMLSLLLALCMVLSILPMSAFAAEGEDTSVEEVTPVEEVPAEEIPSEEPTEEPVEEVPSEEPTEEPVEEIPSEEPTEEPTGEVLAEDVPAEDVPAENTPAGVNLSDDVAVYADSRLSGGTSVGQPFPTSVIGSGHFRIPAFVTLDDGTLVAAADARWRTWNSSYDDAGDIDTIVSYSKDNGANWTYTFANYIENGRSSSNNFAAATFIDPALATDGKTLYMIVDLYPGQGSASQCTSASQSGTGFDSNGYLKLSTTAQATSSSTFAYYLKDGRIYDYSTNTDQGYAVDAYFNVTKDGTDCGNLFNYDNTCGFHPLMTSYLYLTTSTDGGATWSEPRILNTQVKTDSSDTYFLVSPGRGLVTSDGTIVFGAYGGKGACLIYSRDGGVNWSRSASCTSSWGNASENEIVELSSGTLRMFIRHLSGDKLQYVDAIRNSDGSYSWGSIQTMSSITVQDNVNVTAISYSKKTTDGKQVILVAVATSTSGMYARMNGKIFTFTVDGSNNMTLASTYEVNGSNDGYSYSCLTEQSDGSIGLLYEKGDSGNITYVNYDIATITNLTFATDPVKDATVTDATYGVTATAPGLTSITVNEVSHKEENSTVSTVYEISLNGGAYTDKATLKIPVPTDDRYENCVSYYGMVGGDKFDVTVEDGYFLCEVPHFSEVTIYGQEKETVEGGDSGDDSGGSTPVTKEQSYTLNIGKTETDTIAGAYEPPFEIDTSVATVNTSVTYQNASDASTTVMSMPSDGTYTGIIGNGIQWMTLGSNGNIGSTTDPTQATTFTVTRSGNNYTIKAGDYYLYVDGSLGNRSLSPQKSSFDWEFDSGFQKTYNNYFVYAITYSSSWTVSMNASNKANLYTVNPATSGDPTTTITFTGVGPGSTSVTIGDTKYNITVNSSYATASVNLTTGSSTTLNALGELGWTGSDYTVSYKLTNGNCVTLSGDIVTGNGSGTATVEATVQKDGKTYATVTYTINVSEYITNESPFIGGDTQYTTLTAYSTNGTGTNSDLNYSGQDKKITALIITERSKYDLDIASSYSGSVTWGTTNESVITVDTNGVVTAVAIPEDDTPVYVTATINGTTYAIPVTVIATSVDDDTAYVRTLDMYNNLEYNCTAYYSYRLGELKELPYGAQVFVQQDFMDEQDLITFFAAPDEGYALTYVNGSNGDYFHTIRDSSTEEGYGYTEASGGGHDHTLSRPTGGHEWLHDQLIGYTYNNSIRLGLSDEEYLEKMHAMLEDAVSKGCDGGFFWSRYAANNTYGKSMQSDLYFIAEKLPEMSKVLTGITRDGTYQAYTDGMTVGVGDTLHYTIYVNVPNVYYTTDKLTNELNITNAKGTSEINYNNYIVSDDLTKAKWVADTLNSESVEQDFEYSKNGSNSVPKTVIQNYKSSEANYNAAVAKAAAEDGSIHLLNRNSFVYYKADGTQVTYDATVSNTYAYHSDLTLTDENFSEVVTDGTITNTAKLEHSYATTYSKGKGTATSTTVIVDITVEAPSYVIDFGLPITIDLNALVKDVEWTISQNPLYGTAQLVGSQLTYTPNQILPKDDFVTLTYEKNGTTLGTGVRIYPATSVFYEESFLSYNGNWTSEGTAPKAQAAEELGEHSNNYGYDSAYASVKSGSYKESNKWGDTASFIFTGTGFQLYANSESGSGYVTVSNEKDNKIQKVYMINTKLSAGDTEATENQKGDTYYSLPIISETALPYGTYTVTITHTNGSEPIYIDGVRILGTMKDSSIYADDLEDNPDFYELRDYVLKAIGVDKVKDSVYTKESVSELAGQVYNGNSISNDSAVIISDNSIQYPTDSDNSSYAQDLLDNGPKNELYLYKGQTLVFKVKTNRVMQLGLKAPTGSANFTLTVNGTQVKDLTNLSSCVDMFYEIAGKTDTAEEHTVTITVSEGLLSVTLLKICDDPNASFAALTQEDIETALLGIYNVTPEEKPTEPVTPTEPEPTEPETTEPQPTEPETTEPQPTEPETTEPQPTEPEVPQEPETKTTTLTITYVNLFGRKVGSATLTKEMVEGRWIISAREITGSAPAGRRAIWLLPVTLKAGQQQSIVVPVF